MNWTCRDAVLEALDRLERRHGRDTFEMWEIVQEVQSTTDLFEESTIRTHIGSVMCAQAPANHGTTYNDLDRVGRGTYRRRSSHIPVSAHLPTFTLSDGDEEDPESADTSGDSAVQRRAEQVMVGWLQDRLGWALGPKRIRVADGIRMELDIYSENSLIVGEAWAHIGPPKSAQKMKVMTDAMKLLAARKIVGEHARAIILFADDDAAAHFRGASWHRAALEEAKIDLMVAAITAELRAEILDAQRKQFR